MKKTATIPKKDPWRNHWWGISKLCERRGALCSPAATALGILTKEQGWNTAAEHTKGFYWPWHTDPTQKISKKSAITDVVIAGFMDKTCIFSWVKLTIIMRFVRLFILRNYKSNKKTRINCYIILRRHYIWSFNYTIIW